MGTKQASVFFDSLINSEENKDKISNEWWDALRLNHIIFRAKDAELWRSNDLNNGWFNAFGTIKVKRGEIKRWNIKIFERVKQKKNVPVDVVLGVVQSKKARPQDSDGGFWEKGNDGFGFYGWNGKIFH